MCVCVCVCVCVRSCMCVCVRAYVRACVRARARHGEMTIDMISCYAVKSNKALEQIDARINCEIIFYVIRYCQVDICRILC